MFLDTHKAFTCWLIHNLALPLELKCDSDFGYKCVLDHINNVPKNNLPKGFMEHLEDCWVCMSRIVFFLTAKRRLYSNMNIEYISPISETQIIENLRERDAKCSDSIDISKEWVVSKMNHIGEKSYLWIEDGRLCLTIPKWTLRKLIRLDPRDIIPNDVPVVSISYPIGGNNNPLWILLYQISPWK